LAAAYNKAAFKATWRAWRPGESLDSVSKEESCPNKESYLNKES